MPDLVDLMGAALLDASLAAAAISGLLVLVMVQCRQPARRRAWGRAGLLSTLALLPLSALSPVPRFDLWNPILAVVPSNLDEPGPPTRAVTGPPARDRAGPGWLRRAGRVVVLGYLAGASLGIGWLGLGLGGSAWLIRKARPPSAEALGLLDLLPYKGPGTRPRLLVSGRVTRPVLVGLIRPTILIPAGFDRAGATERLRLGLLHELAHAESADHLFGPAATLAQAIWFFLPTAWWVRDRMRIDSEFLADRRAVAHVGTPGRYAASLVDLASARGLGPTGPLGADRAAASGGASALFQRILMLLKCPFPIEDRPPPWWRWATVAAMAAATLAASSLTLRGIAAWSEGAGPPAMEPARSFRLPRLIIDPVDGDDAPFDLRIRLPDRFTLTMEVMADPADLPEMEVLGHRLGPPGATEAGAGRPREVFRPWHRVEIRRDGPREQIRVDGIPVDPRARPRKPAFWLTIRPARGMTTRIRELELSW